MKKKENIGIVIFCVWMALVVGAAVFAPLFAPNDPNATNLSAVQQGASAQYPLGTDMLGAACCPGYCTEPVFRCLPAWGSR